MTSWRVKADVVHGVSVPTTFAGGCIPLTPVGIGIGIGGQDNHQPGTSTISFRCPRQASILRVPLADVGRPSAPGFM